MLSMLLGIIGALLLISGTIVALVVAVVAGFIAVIGIICIIGNLIVHFVKCIMGD